MINVIRHINKKIFYIFYIFYDLYFVMKINSFCYYFEFSFSGTKESLLLLLFLKYKLQNLSYLLFSQRNKGAGKIRENMSRGSESGIRNLCGFCYMGRNVNIYRSILWLKNSRDKKCFMLSKQELRFS